MWMLGWVISDDTATVESGNHFVVSLRRVGGRDQHDRLFLPFRGKLLRSGCALSDRACLCIEQWTSSHSGSPYSGRRYPEAKKREQEIGGKRRIIQDIRSNDDVGSICIGDSYGVPSIASTSYINTP